MCGIVGAVAQRDVADILVEGLRRLEYRGYDSAGVAIINNANELQRVRRLGKVQELADAVNAYKASLEADPAQALAWQNLGNAQQALNNFAKAIEAYDHALAHEPDNLDTLNNKALALKEAGNADKTYRLTWKIAPASPSRER